ncbi:MAG: glycosyltransferase, partial [Adhaeribacter sp.]
MSILLLALVGLYGLVIWRRRQAWQRMPLVPDPPAAGPTPFLSVIIPVRNEETNISQLLQDLARQTYPAQSFEVLVVDDSSTDGTPGRVLAFQNQAGYALRLLHLAQTGAGTGKKQAVAAGVRQARGELLVFTDGDCRVQPQWLRHLAAAYQ